MGRMDDLAQWLTVCLAEDQHQAEEALKRSTTTRRWIGGQWVEDMVQPPEWRRSVWDPARVLREIDAKRQVIAQYAEVAANDTDEVEYAHGWANALGMAVRLLALPYADRAGYREEWRP